jgi:hypothetical protein
MKSPQELLKEGSVSIRNEVKKAYLVTGKLKISPLSATLTPFHTVFLACVLTRRSIAMGFISIAILLASRFSPSQALLSRTG